MARKLLKKWYTLAWLGREGTPHPAHQNFVAVYKDEEVLLEDLAYGMKHFARGAYHAAAWEGQLSPEIAKSRKPLYYVWEDGHVERL